MGIRQVLALGSAVLLVAVTGGRADAWLWVADDWSGGAHGAALGVEADAAPGELVLASELDSLIPAFDATDAYQGIWSLAPYQGRLHMAACTTPMGDTGGDLLSYDPASHAVTLDYSVNEEGNVVVRVEGGLLMCPGLDNLGSWDFGNLYLNDGTGWLRKETVPGALHVCDVVTHEGRLYVTTGVGPPDFQAGLFVSDDLGDTWTQVLAVPPHPPDSYFRRFYGVASWGGALWVQSDFWWPEGKVVYELRGGEVTAHTVPAGAYTLCGFAGYQDKLLCLTGTLLDSWDGSHWHGLLLPQPSHNFGTRALLVYRDRVFVGGFEGASWTSDLATWHLLRIADFAGKEVEAFASFHGRLYAGTNGAGQVYVNPVVPEGTLVSEPWAAPLPFGAGTLTWTGITPPGTALAFQLRSAPSEELLRVAPFLGPDGTAATWYLESGAALAAAHSGHQWLQWRVRLTSGDPVLTPVLEQVTLALEPAEATAAPPASPAEAPLGAWPNPFAATLQLAAPGRAGGDFAIYDAQGRFLRRLTAPAGRVVWDGRDAAGRELPVGVYLIRYERAGEVGETGRVLRLR